jgi:hypothetical protein
MTTTTYQPKFLRAGRTLSRDEAIALIVNGCAVTVAVPDEDLAGMGDLRVTITAGTTTWSADPCAYASLPITGQLHAGDLEVYAAVMAAAASLCNDVNAALLKAELAGEQS